MTPQEACAGMIVHAVFPNNPSIKLESLSQSATSYVLLAGWMSLESDSEGRMASMLSHNARENKAKGV